jgi:shikimate kinase
VSTEPTHIVVTGAMGAGKTTVGRLLGEEIGLAFHDSDETLQRLKGETGAEIARREGVSRLHAVELEIFLDLCEQTPRSVIAPAASVVDHEAGRAAMTANTTIWLTASDEVLASRTRVRGHRRGVAPEERAALGLARDPWLARVSSLKIDTSSLTPVETVAEILDLLG